MKKLAKFLLISCICLPNWGVEITPLPAAKPLLVFSLKDRVETKEPHIFLKDIAEVSGADAELLKRLGDLKVGELPVFGVLKGYTKYDIIRLLRQLKIDAKKVEFEGALKTFVSQPSQKVSGQNILDEAKRYITNNAPKNNAEISVTLKSQIGDFEFPEGQISFEWSVLSGDDFRGAVVLGLNLIQGGEIIKTLALSAVVRVLGTVCTATRDLSKGVILGESDFEFSKQDITHVKGHGMEKIEEGAWIGKCLTRSIKQGAALPEDYLDTPIVIKKGKLLQLLVENGALKMTAMGKAQEDGKLGASVSAKNLDSGKVVFGRVLNQDTLLIQTKEIQ